MKYTIKMLDAYGNPVWECASEFDTEEEAEEAKDALWLCIEEIEED